jgi:sulfur transfer complex TusBCD TusB component (DsrH family)
VVEDDERDGFPKSTRTNVNIAAVADLVKNDSLIASRMIAESLNIPKTVVLRILKEDLGKRNLYAHFASHSLTPEQREDRVISCQDTVAMADADKHFFNKIIWEMKPGVWPVTPKQCNRVLTGLVKHPLGGRN